MICFTCLYQVEAFEQFQLLVALIQDIHLQQANDIWSYTWGTSIFSSRKVYSHFIGNRHPHIAYKWIRNSSCQNKRKIFFWLILKDRLSTRALLLRKYMHLPDYTCVLCHSNVVEDICHLFFHCPFAMACWSAIQVLVPNLQDPCQLVQSFRDQLRLPFAMEVIITMCWSIWMARNDLIFRGLPHSVQMCKMTFKEFALVKLRARTDLHPTMDLWQQILA